MRYLLIILTLISLSANAATNKSKSPSKQETEGFIINKMYQCKDNVDFPTLVEIKGGILKISYKNFSYNYSIPIDLIDRTAIFNRLLSIEMKAENNDVQFKLINIHGQPFSSSQNYFSCYNDKWNKYEKSSLEEADQLLKAFKHFKELNKSESNLFK